MWRDHSTMFYEGLPVHHVLAMGDYTFFWPLGMCRTARLQPSLCSCLRCIYIVSICYHISCYFSCLQVGRAFASKVAHLRDLELRRLAKGLPLRAAKAKAPSITERY